MTRLDEATAVRYNRDGPTDTKFRGLGLGAGGAGGLVFDFEGEDLYSYISTSSEDVEINGVVWPKLNSSDLRHSIQDVAGSLNGRVLVLREDDSNHFGVNLPVGKFKDVELLARITVSHVSSSNALSMILRAGGTTENVEGYALVSRFSDLYLYNYNVEDNGRSQLESDISGEDWEDMEWMWARFRIEGSNIKIKGWLGDLGTEPSGWGVDRENTRWDEEGYISIGGAFPAANQHLYFDYLEVIPI